MAPGALLRVSVCGPPKSGKSSLIKRIVSHRFDNLPTLNAEFMGAPSDGKYVSFLNVPPPFGKLGVSNDGQSSILLELQDQLNEGSAPMLLMEPFWYDVESEAGKARAMDDLSPRSKMLATTSAAASRASDANTMHWTKKVDPRVAKKEAALKAADAAAAGGGDGGKRSGMQPDKPPHPLMATTFDENARLSKAQDAATLVPESVNPLTLAHGTHGWLLVFDTRDAASFDRCVQMAQRLMERVGYERTAKRSCGVTVCLVGNKQDSTAKGKRAAVPPSRVAELLAAYTQPGALVPQLRKQRVDRPLLKLCDLILADRKRIEESSLMVSGGGKGAAADENAEVGGISADVHRALLKLRAELDPMRVSRAHASELELLTGLLACLEHPLAEKLSDEYPASDLAEAVFACPALALKYVEVSCKTNHQIHLLERTLVRALRLLPLPDGQQRARKKQAKEAANTGPGPLEKLGQSLTNLFGGIGGGGQEQCLAPRKTGGDITIGAVSVA